MQRRDDEGMHDLDDDTFAEKYEGRKKNAKGEDGEYLDGEDDLDEDEPMGKSFTVKLADGTAVEAVDGSEMVQALSDQLDRTSEDVQKALGGVVAQIKNSTELLKSLTEQNYSLRGELEMLKSDFGSFAKGGTGRKSALSIHDKPATGEPGKPEGVDPQEVLNKALAAQKDGKIMGLDVARIESYVNRGIAIPETVLKAIA